MQFEKKYVHCMWDESLVGKLCIFADDIPELRILVEQNTTEETSVLAAPDSNPEELAFPFSKNNDSCYKFVYYDPNYICKLAHENGKQIQYFDSEEWLDVANPKWDTDTEYRVKPDKSEPKYRPYKDIDEFIYEYRAMNDSFGEPLVVWLKDINQDIMLMCDGFDRTDNTVRVEGEWWTLEDLFEGYTYLNGTPLGVKE